MTAKYELAAPTPEFPVEVNGKPMVAYYTAGCCGARSFHGLSQPAPDHWSYKGVDSPTPEEVIEAIVTSGVGGVVMLLTDVYQQGEALRAFKEFVEANDLGSVTIAPGVKNRYTGATIYSGVFCYNPDDLLQFHQNNLSKQGKPTWEMPGGWLDGVDKVDIDSAYYRYGGSIQRYDEVKDYQEYAMASGDSKYYLCADWRHDDPTREPE